MRALLFVAAASGPVHGGTGREVPVRKGRVRLHIVVPGVLLLALLALGMALGVVAVASRADPTDAVLAREAANTRANQVADVTGL